MGWFSRLQKKNLDYEEHPLDLPVKFILGASAALWFVGFKFAILKYTTSMPDDWEMFGHLNRAAREDMWSAMYGVGEIHVDAPWFFPALAATLAIIYRMKQWGWTYWTFLVVVAVNLFTWIWLPFAVLDGFLLEWVQEDWERTSATASFFGVEGVISCIAQLICSITLILGWWEFRRVRREVKGG